MLKTNSVRRVSALALILIALIAPYARASQHRILYFYRNYCESCTPEADFAETFFALTGARLEDCEFQGWNVIRSDGVKAYESAKRKYNVEDDALPLAIVDGIAYAGANAMETELARAAIGWYDTANSEIAYLYDPENADCARADAVIASLPRSVTVRRGQETFESGISIQKIDVRAEKAYADALLRAYNVPASADCVPAVFFRETAIVGADAIERDLNGAVALGWAAGGLKTVELKSRSANGLIAAGILIGIAGAMIFYRRKRFGEEHSNAKLSN